LSPALPSATANAFSRMAATREAVGAIMTSSDATGQDAERGIDETPVSLGYDRVRFLAPVFFGDTVTVDYTIAGIDTERRRSTGDITVKNQDGTLVAVATHILKWVRNK